MMVEGVVRFLADDAPAAPSTSAPTVTLALIGLAGLVLSALITGYFGTRGERPRRVAEPGDGQREVDELRRQVDELTHEAALAENEGRDAHVEIERLRVRCAVLERAHWRRGLDPWRFITGDEDDSHARITP